MDCDSLYLCGQSVTNYNKYRPYIKPHVVQPETVTILDSMGAFYAAYPGIKSVDWEVFNSYLMATYAVRLTADKITLIRSILKKMETYKPTIAYDTVIKSLIEMDYLAQIMEECSKARDGSSDLENISSLTSRGLRDVERYLDLDELFVDPDISKTVEKFSSTGYEWRLMVLNKSLGLLRTGNFIIVAARVEVGKTTFLASEATYLVNQLPKGRPLIWVNNEEESETVNFRVVQSAIGWTTEELIANGDAGQKAFDDYVGGDRTKLRITKGDTGQNSVTTLSAMFREVNPGLIIFDQLDKVHGFEKEEREDLRLGRLYKWARELAREYGPVIAASQLTGSVDALKDPPFIGMEHLRGTRSDKQGEADVILTIGKYQSPSTPEEELVRTINVPKNKLPGGGKHYVPSERHGKYLVKLDANRGRYE